MPRIPEQDEARQLRERLHKIRVPIWFAVAANVGLLAKIWLSAWYANILFFLFGPFF